MFKLAEKDNAVIAKGNPVREENADLKEISADNLKAAGRSAVFRMFNII
jgi:hypothetical protein